MSRRYSECSRTYKIVMMRHGQSEWNVENRCCGWYDSLLNEQGRNDALTAAKALKKEGFKFNIAFVSLLKRALTTLQIILCQNQLRNVTTYRTWRLNERHYGALTGLTKEEALAKYGEEQVQLWRRSFGCPPPQMEPTHLHYNAIVGDPRYKKAPKPEVFPTHESIEMCSVRTLCYWNNSIIPRLREGKFPLLVAHGNSLRSLVKHLDNIPDEDIGHLDIPKGIPFYYELDECMEPKVSMQFLGEPFAVQEAMEKVKIKKEKVKEGEKEKDKVKDKEKVKEKVNEKVEEKGKGNEKEKEKKT